MLNANLTMTWLITLLLNPHLTLGLRPMAILKSLTTPPLTLTLHPRHSSLAKHPNGGGGLEKRPDSLFSRAVVLHWSSQYTSMSHYSLSHDPKVINHLTILQSSTMPSCTIRNTEKTLKAETIGGETR